MRPVARAGLEVLGVLVLLAPHPWIGWIYVLGGEGLGAAFWLGLGAGYAGMLALAVTGRPALRRIPPRARLDACLLAFPVALGASALLVRARWPLAFPAWDAHGAGARGGEANALFLPWLHVLLWVAAARHWKTRGGVLTPPASE